MATENSILDHCTARSMQPAESKDVAAILGSYADQAVLLWRTQEDIEQHASEFLVIEHLDEIIGCLALRDYGNHLMEIRSLAVKDSFTGHGCGSLLIEKGIETAAQQGITKMFALTVRPGLFLRHGFEEVDKELFPEKVWRDCESCPKKDACIEIAVARDIP